MDSVVHFEIPAENTERAQKFYSTCFGWQIQEIPEMKYTIVRTGKVNKDMMPEKPGFINGGMMKRGEIKSPVITINVDDITRSLDKIKKAGGKILKEPMKVGDMGLAAYFTDSEGNVMGLWQSVMK